MQLIPSEEARTVSRTLGLTLIACWIAGEVIGKRPGLLPGGDFVAFYTGARFWMEGRGAGMFDLQAQELFQHTLAANGSQTVHPYLSPPWALPLFLPFGWMPYPAAIAAWWVLQIGAAAWGVDVLRRALLPDVERKDALFSFFTFPAAIIFVVFGQASGTLLLWSALGLVAMRERRDVTAGAWISLMWIKPQLVIFWLMLSVLQRRWRMLGTMVAGGALALALGYLIDPAAARVWPRFAVALDALFRSEGFPSWGLATAYGFAVVAFQKWMPALVAPVAGVGATALLGWSAWRLLRRPGDDVVLAGAMIAGLAATAHLWWYDLTLLAVPMALAWRKVDSRELAVLGALTLFGPLLTALTSPFTGNMSGVNLTFLVLVVVAVRWMRDPVDGATFPTTADAPTPAPAS